MNPLDVSPENIWQFKQNKPSLVIKDMEEFGIAPEITEKVLLARGVNKWLFARRDIIHLKHDIKKQITSTITEIHIAKTSKDFVLRHKLRGRVNTLVTIQKAIKAICHSERWRPGDPR